jgi:hypothetical protein
MYSTGSALSLLLTCPAGGATEPYGKDMVDESRCQGYCVSCRNAALYKVLGSCVFLQTCMYMAFSAYENGLFRELPYVLFGSHGTYASLWGKLSS